MKRVYVVVLILLVAASSSIVRGQDATPAPSTFDPRDYAMRVFVDSGFLRTLPDRESDPVGSVFENDSLVGIGRNADGTWFLVRRPGGTLSAGWISRDLVLYTFDVSGLPMTDLTTGVTGPEAVYDTGISVIVVLEAALRSQPYLDAEGIGILPIQRTIPALARTADSAWVKVNYLGTVGWVAEFLIRVRPEIADLPVEQFSAGGADSGGPRLPVTIVPAAAQRAQVQRIRDFARPLLAVSDTLTVFWSQILTGETVRCNPPAAALYPNYTYTVRDLYELPEIGRNARLLNGAVAALNESLETSQTCGVYFADEASRAYARALSASSQFQLVLSRMDSVEAVIAEE